MTAVTSRSLIASATLEATPPHSLPLPRPLDIDAKASDAAMPQPGDRNAEPGISVVVPVYNEAGNIPALIAEIAAAAALVPIREIVYVDDGSTDGSLRLLQQRLGDVGMLRIVRHRRCLGQSAAFLSGARAASQDLLVFMDGDLQNDPADVASLYRCYRAAPLGSRLAVLGERAVRNDRWLRRLSSRLANRLRRAVLKDGTRDTGCSLKLIPRRDFLDLPYFDHMHRFLPAMLLRNGVEITHVSVSHRARVNGRSKYGFWNRAAVGAVDLLGAAWLSRRRLPADYEPIEISKTDFR
ncbi:glycosyltransferase family 2 protein [Mesorhizobium marinum]|uniref:Glycosyltransferase family 2 protein n=1 Tax=Mesorhizobium marinum TaxID=3228790 RepID=A0ABV3R4J4_9HYPH